MYNTLVNCFKYSAGSFNSFTQTRYLSAKEISAALRQFYFSVHPDLFGKYPAQRVTNENSLKQLSEYLEKVRTQKPFRPCTIYFYLRESKSNDNGKFRTVQISLKGSNIHHTITNILKTCNLSTEYIDTIAQPSPSHSQRSHPPPPPKSQFYTYEQQYQQQYDQEYDMDNMIKMKQRIKKQKEKDKHNLRNFLEENAAAARKKYDDNIELRKDIKNLCDDLYKKFELKDIRWDCGWNDIHIRGCLRSFVSLSNEYPEKMTVLQDRILVFAPFTGVSLDGHIMLNSGDVRHKWLDLIKSLRVHDSALLRIPSFEMAVSQILKNIRVVRRKFMPKVTAKTYESNLLLLMTNINDYCGRNSFPKSWPKSLSKYQLVVETEAGPLMVSPTGQFIVPSTCPGVLLVNFMTENLENAAEKIMNYNAQKHIEKFLHALCVKELKLNALRKDDNITPDLMIKCLEIILENKPHLNSLEGLQLNISTYYSVLGDGVVCIPWNCNI